MPTLSQMIARPSFSYSLFFRIIPCLITLWGLALMPLLALEKNRLEGPPGSSYAFGDEFDGTLVNDEMWALEKNRLWSGLWWHDFRAHEIYDGIPSDCLIERSEDHFFINKQVYKAHWGHGGKIEGNRVNFYEFFTFGLKVTDDEFFWYLTQDGPAWKTEPYFQFSGGKVKNRTYGKVKDFEWEREVPKNLHAQVILNYAMRNAKWAGGPVQDDQLPSKMYVDYVRFFHLP